MNVTEYISCGKNVYDFFEDGIIITNPDHFILYVNKSACSLLGYKKDELLNQTISLVSTDATEIITSPQFRNIPNAKKITPRRVSFEKKRKINFETLTWLSSLGDIHTNVGYMVTFKNPLRTHDKENKHFKERVSFLKALNSKKDEFCYVSDLRNGRNVFVSDSVEKFLGWEPENFLNGSWAFAISKTHPDDVSNIEAYYKKRERLYKHPYEYDHLPLIYSYRMMHKHGHYVNVQYTVVLLERDKNGAPKYTLNFGKLLKNKHPKKISEQSSFKLTSREKDLARLLINGDSSKIIAQKLGLSIHTVNEFRQEMKRKIGASNTADAIRIILENNLAN